MPPKRGMGFIFCDFVYNEKKYLVILLGAYSVNKDKKVYKLFAMPIKDTTEEAIEHYRFCRVTPLYALVYTAGEQPANSAEVEENDIECLSLADRHWLLECNIELIAEDAKAREQEISAALSEKIEKLEQALEEAKKQGERI